MATSDAMLAEMRAHPMVQEILQAFPGSQVMTKREARVMTDPTEEEFAAMEQALPAMGEFLEEVFGNKEGTVYDFGAMSEDQMMQLIEVIITAYVDALAAGVAVRNDADPR